MNHSRFVSNMELCEAGPEILELYLEKNENLGGESRLS